MGKFVLYDAVRNVRWKLWQNDSGKYNDQNVQQAILMDIRSNLAALLDIFQCTNAQQIPAVLKQIAANTTKKRRTR